MNLFLLSYNPFEGKMSPNQLLGWIKESPRITQWYSPFSGTYILKSTENLEAITDLFNTAFDGGQFLLTQPPLTNMNGYMPAQAWQWMSAQGLLGLTVAPPPPR